MIESVDLIHSNSRP